jgi:hypothetical protein
MKKGIVIFSYSNRDIDYSLLALISGGLAKKNLNLPVSLITDSSTIDWMKESDTYSLALDLFDQIIISDRPNINNKRLIFDGIDSKVVPFLNSNRSSVWDLTPYDHTLLIDSDLLIMSDRLNTYWNMDNDLMMVESMKDIRGDRSGTLDQWISDTGVKMYWATAIMFKKNQKTKTFFNLIDHVRENYLFYADVYRFETRTYRNDIAFSIAKHMLDGFLNSEFETLPPQLTVFDKDDLVEVNESNLIFLIRDFDFEDNFFAVNLKEQDVHVMNKQSIIRNKDKLMKLI